MAHSPARASDSSSLSQHLPPGIAQQPPAADAAAADAALQEMQRAAEEAVVERLLAARERYNRAKAAVAAATGLVVEVEPALADAKAKLAAAAAAATAQAASLTAVQVLQAHPVPAQRPSPEEARDLSFFALILKVEEPEAYLRGVFVYRLLHDAMEEDPVHAQTLQELAWDPDSFSEKALLMCCWLCCSADVRAVSEEAVLWHVSPGSLMPRLSGAVEQVLGEDLQGLQGYDEFLAACLGDEGV